MLNTLFVADPVTAECLSDLPNVLLFEHYLKDYPKLNEPKLRIVNLCDTEKYLSVGYYCSLLAEARQHRVVPSVQTLNAMRNEVTVPISDQWLSRAELKAVRELTQPLDMVVCLGTSQIDTFRWLGQKVFQTYPVPIIKVKILPLEQKITIEKCSLSPLEDSSKAFVVQQLKELRGVWRKKRMHKAYRWDMAILINPEEPTPPSNKGALKRFMKAADKLGIRADLVSSKELLDVNQYDALFVRETTAIDHPTYRLATEGEQNGLVVMDDSSSILRCCNKVFLHDAFQYQGVPTPKTKIVYGADASVLDDLEAQFQYPMILKMPESSFSKGVFKVKTREELAQKLAVLLKESALALVQEYLYTDYDWRIGVLNGRAIYACKYYMAQGHWQIYNHASKRNFSGGFESLPTFEVPRAVLDAALKASKAVGTSLYGVDIKVVEDKPYVIEVNDNPNVDHKVEDAYVGDELYMQIMSEFLRRLELRGRSL